MCFYLQRKPTTRYVCHKLNAQRNTIALTVKTSLWNKLRSSELFNSVFLHVFLVPVYSKTTPCSACCGLPWTLLCAMSIAFLLVVSYVLLHVLCHWHCYFVPWTLLLYILYAVYCHIIIFCAVSTASSRTICRVLLHGLFQLHSSYILYAVYCYMFYAAGAAASYTVA